MNRTPQIDRYAPAARGSNRDGDYYTPTHRTDRYRSLAGSAGYSAPKSDDSHPRPKYQDPHTLAFQVPFHQFAEWYQQIEPAGAEAPNKDELAMKYEEYKYDLYARLARGFVVQHKDEQWFKEKYDPALAKETSHSIMEYRKLCFREFMLDFAAGKFDDFTLESDRRDGDAKKVLLIKTIAPHISRDQLVELVKDIPGYQFLSLSDANPLKRFHRIGWVMLSSENDLERSIEQLEGQNIHDDVAGDFTMHVGVHAMVRPMKRKYLYPYLSSDEYLRKDHENSYKAARKYETEFENPEFGAVDKIREHARQIATKKYNELVAAKKAEVEDQEEEGMVVEEEDGAKLQKEVIKKELDLTILYLRQVFSFCYYCIVSCDSICDLSKKCPAGHLRRLQPPPDADELTKRNYTYPDIRAQNWIKSWTDRFALFLNPASGDLKKLGGRPLEETVQAEITAHIKQEDEGKFRCKVGTCTKLFKGEDFVRKHIEKRHPEFIENLEQENTLLNGYVLDPCRLLPPKPEGNLPYQAVDTDLDANTQENAVPNATQNSGSSESVAAATTVVTFAGLPIAYPQLVPLSGQHGRGIPANGYFQADPFAYGQNDVAETKYGTARHQASPMNLTPSHNARNGSDKWRRRSRSPQHHDFNSGRRDYRDRSDYRQSPRDYEWEKDHGRLERGWDSDRRRDHDRDRDRGRDRDRERERERDRDRDRQAPDPRGRRLTSYMDLDTPVLDY
ncbi:hypothetical protein V1517DRAFT_253412 [Lipomyces orientalis]|uniref:Uncharacterized protein n=1 Tax=Lipomyces orientalis TaxID=1233043 RepID=A0ACC3TXR1_9ASCO